MFQNIINILLYFMIAFCITEVVIFIFNSFKIRETMPPPPTPPMECAHASKVNPPRLKDVQYPPGFLFFSTMSVFIPAFAR